SVGDYPIITVETMARIIKNTEVKGRDRFAPYTSIPKTRGGAVTQAAADIAEKLGVNYIVTFTQSGDSAQRMARLRPETKMIALTPREETQRRLALSWGVQVEVVDHADTTDEMVAIVDRVLKETGRAKDGDYVVVVSGTPIGVPGT